MAAAPLPVSMMVLFRAWTLTLLPIPPADFGAIVAPSIDAVVLSAVKSTELLPAPETLAVPDPALGFAAVTLLTAVLIFCTMAPAFAFAKSATKSL